MSPAPEALEQAFLDDIVGNPSDPSLWLILADWLDEREDPRGELVRLTWQLQYEPDHADFKQRQNRVQALLAAGMKPVRPRRSLGGLELAWIPPGSFLMGSPPEEAHRSGNEQQHRVTLTRAFWMGVFPITQSQWLTVTGSNPTAFSPQGPRHDNIRGCKRDDLLRFPIDSVSWTQANHFRDRLRELLGQPITLPTEAQWEYACRAGTTSPFHFGGVLNGKQASCDGGVPYGTTRKGPFLNRPSPVGSFPPNAWGLYDMHGNMLEWCLDAYREQYERLPATDPVYHSPRAGQRIARGGCWYSNSHACRSALRLHYGPDDFSIYLGLRICCPAE
jgi:uncharacterized protein (TIGR02996 family)